MKKQRLITGLKEDRPEALRDIYLAHRKAFLRYAKKYPITTSMAEDVYQDAIIILRDNARQGKLDNLKSELRTYLFSIGKYLIYSQLRAQQKVHLVEDFSEMYQEQTLMTDIVEATMHTDEQRDQMQLALEKLGGKCREILYLFYYRGFSLEEIVEKLDYSNKDVAKSQKSRCLKSLKTLVQSPSYG
ncbi:sigma-70 family RNA polymerase sigma factor [uncultured Dokdonia sp.]|uniref:RNA polymerase sigma factor n=1 Tax=uncultured Dokdonia sp. TaxID=575653 RepID=UPI00260F14AA|nr:sigma-70 family RNA polymerase sigma factor [uncultured Dokdonia sp.]